MNRWVGVVIVVALLAIGFVGYSRPELFPGVDVTQIVWVLMALLLWTGAAYGFPEIRHDWRRALVGALFWGGMIVAIVLIYNWFN